MKINNFRGIGRMEIDFRYQTNLFVGINGSGKTSILDCTAIMLSRFFVRIKNINAHGRMFVLDDIKNGESVTDSSITLSEPDANNKAIARPFTYRMAKHKYGQKPNNINRRLCMHSIVNKLHQMMENDPKTNILIAVNYPVNRGVLDIPLKTKNRSTFDKSTSAYDGAFLSAANFRTFCQWW